VCFLEDQISNDEISLGNYIMPIPNGLGTVLLHAEKNGYEEWESRAPRPHIVSVR
jgi:hypothetical protein